MTTRATSLAETIQPIHQHDCNACIFIGQRVANVHTYDFYYCESSYGGPSIIARYGEYGDYQSCKVSQMIERPRYPDYPLDWAYAAFVVAGW